MTNNTLEILDLELIRDGIRPWMDCWTNLDLFSEGNREERGFDPAVINYKNRWSNYLIDVAERPHHLADLFEAWENCVEMIAEADPDTCTAAEVYELKQDLNAIEWSLAQHGITMEAAF